MFVEQIFPAVVEAKGSLPECLAFDARSAGMAEDQIAILLAVVPPGLLRASCFLDRMTGFWRYEFGEPFYLEKSNQLLWGTHMWVPVWQLREGLAAMLTYVADDKRALFLARLDDPQKHLDALSEMVPVLRLENGTLAEFEIAGTGHGNTTVDWQIDPPAQRRILVDVKYRAVDLIRQLDQLPEGQRVPEPAHDPALLFRSVENKFGMADPDTCLQGVWIVTNIQQEGSELVDAFAGLAAAKVHFAILGDWERDAHILVRREEDRPILFKSFGLEESGRFTFARAQ